MNFYPNIIL